ncbi:MAG: hypothetical protein KC420_01000 [Myxococcales bacterium]|nr:hypothetical protein [Myxococcales bacterium]
MTLSPASSLIGLGLTLGLMLGACAPNEDAGQCDQSRPCTERGEICDTVDKVCIAADFDVDETAPGPANGSFGPSVVPFFRGKVCVATKAKPGERIPVSISPCLHPCVSPGPFTQVNKWQCSGSLCEGLNLMYLSAATGVGCPAEVFGRFDAGSCAYPLTIDAGQGPFNPAGIFFNGTATTEIPFLSNEEMARVANNASNDEIWSMVKAYPQEDSRVFSISLSDANPSAPANCTDDPSLCECRDVGF